MTLPGQVNLTNVSATGASSVKLTWKAVDGVTGYMIYRLDTATGEYRQIATVKSARTLFYSDQKLAAGKTYTYKVSAYKTYRNKNYRGAYSAEKQVNDQKSGKTCKSSKGKNDKTQYKRCSSYRAVE